MDTTPNVLGQLIKEREDSYKKLATLTSKYRMAKPEPPFDKLPSLAYLPPTLIRRINECIARLKVINHRISRLGERYAIVRVWGNYYAKQGKLSILKNFEMYYTEISEYDATCKARNYYNGEVHEIHTSIIPTGTDISKNFFK